MPDSFWINIFVEASCVQATPSVQMYNLLNTLFHQLYIANPRGGLLQTTSSSIKKRPRYRTVYLPGFKYLAVSYQTVSSSRGFHWILSLQAYVLPTIDTRDHIYYVTSLSLYHPFLYKDTAYWPISWQGWPKFYLLQPNRVLKSLPPD